MAFSNGQTVTAADLNNFSVTTVTTSGDITVGDDVIVTDDVTVGGDLAVTGTITLGGVPITATVLKNTVCGRLTLTTAEPVTISDVTAATTLYFALYEGNQIALYSGSAWVLFSIAQLSIAVPGTTNQMYDVFVDYNAGTPALALNAWTNDTTRATALTKQDGVYVLTGSTGKRFVGCMRTTAVSGQTEDSFAKRFVWNYYNRVPRDMRALESTNSWDYTTATWRQANNATANKFEFILGVAEVPLQATVHAYANQQVATNSLVQIAVGLDSTTTPTTGNVGRAFAISDALAAFHGEAHLHVYPAVGYHYAAWLERANATGTARWYGDNGDDTLLQAGIFGSIDG